MSDDKPPAPDSVETIPMIPLPKDPMERGKFFVQKMVLDGEVTMSIPKIRLHQNRERTKNLVFAMMHAEFSRMKELGVINQIPQFKVELRGTFATITFSKKDVAQIKETLIKDASDNKK